MTHATRWIVVIFGLLGGVALMLSIVFNFGTASAVITFTVTIFSAAAAVTQSFSTPAERQPPHPNAPAGTSPKNRRPRGPWVIMGAGWALTVLAGVIVAAVKPDLTGDPAGTLRMSLDTSQPSAVNLTTSQSSDWVNWGYNASDASKTSEFAGGDLRDECSYNAHCVNRKMGGDQISDFTPIGNTTPTRVRWRDNPLMFGWSDGTPIRSATGVQSSIMAGLAGNGFRVTAPAGPEKRVFTIFVSTWQAKAKAVASLSDDSTPAVTDDSLSTFGQTDEGQFGVYTITYRATRPDQTLTFEITVKEDIGGGSISLYSATLR